MNSRWNTTEAYDLSLYEIPAEPVRKPQPAPALRKKAKTQKAVQRSAIRRLAVCAGVLVLGLCVGLLFGQRILHLLLERLLV